MCLIIRCNKFLYTHRNDTAKVTLPAQKLLQEKAIHLNGLPAHDVCLLAGIKSMCVILQPLFVMKGIQNHVGDRFLYNSVNIDENILFNNVC